MTVNVLLTIFVSQFVLCLFQKQIQLVFLSMAIIWFVLWRQYPIHKNLKLYGKLFSISIVFNVIYFFKMVHEGKCLESVDWKEVGCFGFLLIGVLLITVVIEMVYRFIRWFSGRLKKQTVAQNKLYMERRHDIEKVQRYLEKFNVVVLDAAWGSGKSFIASSLMCDEKMQEKYIFVPISLLSCNLEEAQNTIFF